MQQRGGRPPKLDVDGKEVLVLRFEAIRDAEDLSRYATMPDGSQRLCEGLRIKKGQRVTHRSGYDWVKLCTGKNPVFAPCEWMTEKQWQEHPAQRQAAGTLPEEVREAVDVSALEVEADAAAARSKAGKR